MNTVTLSAAESSTEAGAAAASSLLLLPLSKLRPSSHNVRKTDAGSILELAASIERIGLLQNLTVIAASAGHYEVVAGQRRLAALKLLAKKKRLAKTYEVPCLLVPEDAAGVVSLTENVQREAMHPADQFEAFAALVAAGRPIEDVAADFGVTPLVVRRRLKLANVSPRLIADYRGGDVTLDQLMALAVTDDHAAQEAAFYDSPQWQRSADALREHLTANEIDAERDAVARFVGADYEAAGGGVRRDLFTDEAQGGYLTDTVLLDKLALAKLAPTAENVKAEGWSWVEVVPRSRSGDLYAFGRARRDVGEPTPAQAERTEQIESRQHAIEVALEDEDAELSEDDEEALNDEYTRLDAELSEIEQSQLVFALEAHAIAGAVITLGRQGEIVVHRGLVREGDSKALRALEKSNGATSDVSEGQPEKASKRPISETLARRLSSHRTAALQLEVARHPDAALVAVVHALALDVICLVGYNQGAVNIRATRQDRFGTDAPDVADSAAALGLQAMRQTWEARLPENPDDLFAELLTFQQRELLALLAVCVASTVGAVTPREEIPAASLARTVELDMHQWWTPTAVSYFAHVSKAQIIEAVQTFAPGDVARLSKLKKQDLASEAERLAAGSAWLPAMLDLPAPLPENG